MGCDKYEYMYKHFVRFARANFPLNIKYFGETIPFPDEETTLLGEAPWNDRFRWALNSINTPHVAYLQEDFLIKSVDMEALIGAYELHKKYKAHITKLGTNFEFTVSRFPEIILNHQVYLQNAADTYLLSHQPVCFFSREFLLSTITDKTTDASLHEIEGSHIMRTTLQTKVFTIGQPNNPNKSDIFTIEHAIRKGVLLDDARKMIET